MNNQKKREFQAVRFTTCLKIIYTSLICVSFIFHQDLASDIIFKSMPFATGSLLNCQDSQINNEYS